MILAAGFGTRMRPLTDNCPKPLLAVAGKPLIVHHIEKLVALGISDIVINHAYLGQMIEDTLGDGSQWNCKIHYSAESEALETGGGIYQALPLLTANANSDEPFLLVNGDVWLEWDRIRLPSKVLGLCHLWLVENPEHNPAGDFVLLESGTVFDKNTQTEISTEKAFTFSGISLIKPTLFTGVAADAGAFPLAPLLRQAMANNLASGEVFLGHWVDVGTPERLNEVSEYISKTQSLTTQARTSINRHGA